MNSLQRRIITVSDSSANLIAQLRELDQLRDQLRKALVSAKKAPGRKRHSRNGVASISRQNSPP